MKLIGRDTDKVRFAWVTNQLSRVPPGARILDAGAGELRFKPFCKHLDYVAQDFGQYSGDGDGAALQTGAWDNTKIDILSDITDIPVQNESFDVVLCSEVLEHVPDALSAIRELSRVLKPGGTLLLTAPFNSLTHFAPYHFGGYNRYWYQHHFPRLGLNIEILDHNGSWFAYVAQELRRSNFVARRYSSPALGLVTRLAMVPIWLLLSLLAARDRGSHELLCFGFMISATKKTSDKAEL
jgi:ubiquinone/menaquinone biosynthesis C-methylase UbiE